MGLISRVIGGPAATTAFAQAVTGVAEVFTPNATRRMQAGQEAYLAALDEFGTEFQYDRPGLFDRFVNGLNRLPRPMLALGTLGLFVYAMVDPVRFAERMVGLNLVPEPLWWLLAAIVGFYFGAREAFYLRARPNDRAQRNTDFRAPRDAVTPGPRATSAGDANSALREWRDRDER